MLLGTRLQLLETVVQRVVSQGCSDGVQWMRHILASGLHACVPFRPVAAPSDAVILYERFAICRMRWTW